jgi:hypothetical protein
MATTYSKNPIVKGNFEKPKSFEDNLDSQELKIRKGQAYNCAITSAAALGKLDDTKFICKEFLRHLQFANFLQKARVEDLVTALDNPEFVGILNNLEEHLKYLKEVVQ